MTTTPDVAAPHSSPRARGLFDKLADGAYEQIVLGHDASTGLRSVIAIHDTTLGPALGGVRMWPYDSEEAAVEDCLRLAKGMTLKAAAAGVNLGGAKSVIIGDPSRDKTEALLRAHGRLVRTLGGRYIPGVDVGTTREDLEVIGVEARPVSCALRDPSEMTALGVREGIRACVQAAGGSSLAEITIAVQGAGKVGAGLVRLLAAESARLIVSDVDSRRAEEIAAEVGATVADPAAIVASECDVLAPCALGAVINDDTIDRLRCRIVAGGANNVLAAPRHGAALHERGILYAPDFCINAGGLIQCEDEVLGLDLDLSERRVRRVGDIIAGVIERARRDGIPTSDAAVAVAHERLESLRRIGPRYVA